MQETKFYTKGEIKAKRIEIDTLIQFVKNEQENGHPGIHVEDWELHSMASYQVLVHLINAKMWLGKMLESIENDYPEELADNAKKEKVLICNLPHCRCMQESPCGNHHYVDSCYKQ